MYIKQLDNIMTQEVCGKEKHHKLGACVYHNTLLNAGDKMCSLMYVQNVTEHNVCGMYVYGVV